MGSMPDQDVDNSITLFERWQRLLLTQEVMDSRTAFAEFKQKLESLEHQIYEPTQLSNLLLPLIADLLLERSLRPGRKWLKPLLQLLMK
jgi:hypothetical protein